MWSLVRMLLAHRICMQSKEDSMTHNEQATVYIAPNGSTSGEPYGIGFEHCGPLHGASAQPELGLPCLASALTRPPPFFQAAQTVPWTFVSPGAGYQAVVICPCRLRNSAITAVPRCRGVNLEAASESGGKRYSDALGAQALRCYERCVRYMQRAAPLSRAAAS